MNKCKIINMVLIITTIVVFTSGMLIYPMNQSMLMTAIHKISACLWVILGVTHICQHKKQNHYLD